MRDLLDNKHVIIVGPSPLYKGSGMGAWIDSFDTVIRTNGASFLIDNIEYQRDYGKKCTILVLNIEFLRSGVKVDTEDLIQNYDLKGLLLKERREGSPIQDKRLETEVLKSHETQGIGPFTGVKLVDHVLRYKVKSLYLTGVDFYIDEDQRYLDGYLLKSSIEKQKQLKASPRKTPVHDGLANHKYIYRLFKEGRLNLDALAEKNLEKKLNQLEGNTNNGQ